MRVVFETERLAVVPWRDDHAEAAHAAYSRPDFVRYLGNPTPHPDLAYTRAWVARLADHPGFWAVESRDTGEVIGAAVLQPLPGDEKWEVGWHVFPGHQRNGYATEIGRGAIAHGFANGLNDIYAVVNPANTASLAVAKAVGMRSVGLTDRYYGTTLELFVVNRDG